MDIYRHPYPPDMPMGLDIALSKNRIARDYFYALPDAEKKRIIDHTHVIRSKEEMQSFVDSLVK
jgi:hypothetical protein